MVSRFDQFHSFNFVRWFKEWLTFETSFFNNFHVLVFHYFEMIIQAIEKMLKQFSRFFTFLMH